MLIRALDEALSPIDIFRPELTVIGTTSGGMSFGEDYYRALDRNRDLRFSPTLGRELSSTKGGD